jgi:dihydrofolate reductase
MGKVIIVVSMSLDGFVAGPNPRVAAPLGDGGERLHEWMFAAAPHPFDAAVASSRFAVETVGAVAMGRTTFDCGIGEWGDDGTFRTPCFVVTHRPGEPVVKGPTTFTFVTDGVDAAVALAQRAAGEQDVCVMGADVGAQALRAGLVDELFVDVVPVLLGEGARLFHGDGGAPIDLERTALVATPAATHAAFRVLPSR